MPVRFEMRMPDDVAELLDAEHKRTGQTRAKIVSAALKGLLGPPQTAPTSTTPNGTSGGKAHATGSAPIQHQERPFKCPDNRCRNRFGSAAAQCPIHGRKAVPA